jgi:hypothetical protein
MDTTCRGLIHNSKWRIHILVIQGGKGNSIRGRQKWRAGTTHIIYAITRHLQLTCFLQLQISTSSSTTDGPTYTVTAKTRSTSSAPWKTTKISSPLSNWFSKDGYFVAKPFQRFLARGIPVVGEADPKNASAVEEPAVKVQPANAATGQQQQFNVNISNLPDVLKHIQAQGNTATKRK